jgi:hypothetical protein
MDWIRIGRRIPAWLYIGFLVLALPASAQEKLSKGPIVQLVQTDRATINWVTVKTVGELSKEGGGAPAAINEPVYHQVEMTGLEPGTLYHYDLRQYGVDAQGSFTTAPAGDKPFTFIVFGDTRTRHDVHKRVIERIVSEKPPFVLQTGDLVSNGLNPGDWDRFFEIERDLLRNTAYYPVLGNHERNAPSSPNTFRCRVETATAIPSTGGAPTSSASIPISSIPRSSARCRNGCGRT